MASTTLITFNFECPGVARTVELLGSWDNFVQSYQLQPDRRRGPRIWSGCYTFENIICDGDLSNLCEKRNGALKMGGTYWYYYKVDDEVERHDPSEPSTTVCPLLPGQRLNVLEVPMESNGTTDSLSPATSDAFTRNPNDKYLTPVPPSPMPQPSPRLGDLCKETYKVPMHPLGPPRSATYPPQSRSLSPGPYRLIHSAATSPQFPSHLTSPDFRGFKERFLTPKPVGSDSRGRSGKSSVAQGLAIGPPILISSTAEDMTLMPLPTPQPTQTSPTKPPLLPLAAAKLQEFSPLGSHPVDPFKDFDFGFLDASSEVEEQSHHRSRSFTEPPIIPEIKVQFGRARANSSETRRTKQYPLGPNEPWVSTPVLGEGPAASLRLAPIPQRTSVSQGHSATLDDRPQSRRGESRNPTLRTAPQTDKALPELPRYLTPAPLFACNGSSVKEAPIDNTESPNLALAEPSSHFSTWSTESTVYSPLASEAEDATPSPTSSVATGTSSVLGTPKRFSDQFEHNNQGHHGHLTNDENTNHAVDVLGSPALTLDTPIFGPNLFQLDIHRTNTGSRRQAACFGFSGYRLPDEGNESRSNNAKVATTTTEPSIKSCNDDSTSQRDKLMDDFGYLGEALL